MNDDAPGMYSTNSQIKFQTMMLKSRLVTLVMHRYLLQELKPLQTWE